MKPATIAAILFLLGFSAFSIKVKYDLRATEEATSKLSFYDDAPTFVLDDLDGNKVDLSAVIGSSKVVVLNFWATWCGPCRIEMPTLEQIHQKYKERGVALLAITGESSDIVESFIREHGYTMPVLLDASDAVGKAYGVEALPTTFVIDSDGKVRDITAGVAMRLEFELESVLERKQADE